MLENIKINESFYHLSLEIAFTLIDKLNPKMKRILVKTLDLKPNVSPKLKL